MFGGTPTHWLTEVPVEVFRYCEKYAQKHDAQRRIAALVDLAAGTGTMRDASGHIDDLYLASRGQFRIPATVHTSKTKPPFRAKRARLRMTVEEWLG